MGIELDTELGTVGVGTVIIDAEHTSWSGSGTADYLYLHGGNVDAYDTLLVGPAHFSNVGPVDGSVLPVRPKHETGIYSHAERMINGVVFVAHDHPSLISVDINALQGICLCINPVNLMFLVVDCDAIGPINILADENLTSGTIHVCSFYIVLAPVTPEHKTACA